MWDQGLGTFVFIISTNGFNALLGSMRSKISDKTEMKGTSNIEQ